jgi:hypothetical protein
MGPVAALAALGHPPGVEARSTQSQVLDELRRPGQQLAVGRDDEGVAVEDQLVLPATRLQ